MSRNPVGWFEIYVQDMARAKAFYEAVFETRLERLDSPGIEMWAFPMQPDLPGTAGSLVHAPGVPSGGGGTLVYFSCDDCAEQAARATAAGGTMLKDKFSIGPYGFVALVHDTEGNLVGLHSMR
jgi:hypothetical protein